MKKRIATVLLGCTLAAAVLTGCQDGEKGKNTEEGGLIEVSFGRSTTSNPKFPEGDTYENNAYTRYLEKKLNVKVVNAFEANGDDYTRQISLAIASGDLPDVMRVGKAELDELVENDLIGDLTEVYETYASDYIKDIYDSYDGRVLASATYDGKLMALPGANVDGAPTMAWVRQDWLDKLGLTVDEDGNGGVSLEELKEVAIAFKENDPSECGNPVPIAFMPDLSSADNNSSFVFTAITAAMDAYPQQWLQDENGEVYYGTMTEEMKEALTLLHSWFEEGLIDEQYGTRTWDDISSIIVNEQNGIVFGPWHTPDWLLNNVHARNSEAQFIAFAIEDENGKVNAFHANPTTSGYMVVSKDFAHPELLVQMENLFYDELQTSKTLEADEPEVFSYIQNAVDGTAKPWQVEVLSSFSLLDDYDEYTKCLNGEMTVEELSRLESKAIVDAISNYQNGVEDSSGWARYTSRLKGVGLIKRLTENDLFAWITPLYPSTTATMKTASANLHKMETENIIGFITGTKSLDEFDKFVEDWKAQGGSQITKEVTEALQ